MSRAPLGKLAQPEPLVKEERQEPQVQLGRQVYWALLGHQVLQGPPDLKGQLGLLGQMVQPAILVPKEGQEFGVVPVLVVARDPSGLRVLREPRVWLDERVQRVLPERWVQWAVLELLAQRGPQERLARLVPQVLQGPVERREPQGSLVQMERMASQGLRGPQGLLALRGERELLVPPGRLEPQVQLDLKALMDKWEPLASLETQEHRVQMVPQAMLVPLEIPELLALLESLGPRARQGHPEPRDPREDRVFRAARGQRDYKVIQVSLVRQETQGPQGLLGHWVHQDWQDQVGLQVHRVFLA